MGDALTLFDSLAEEVLSDEAPYRASDPVTSKQAALIVKAGSQRARILDALSKAQRGMTGYEASIRCGIKRVHGATTRLEELEHLGFATRDGETRPTDTGCQASVWSITAAGRKAAAEVELIGRAVSGMEEK